MKYKLHHKNEGSWIKWSIVDNKNIVKFVGLYKDTIEWLFSHHKWHKDWLGCWICERRLKNKKVNVNRKIWN